MHIIVERLGAPRDTISPKISFNSIPPSTKLLRPILCIIIFFFRSYTGLATLRSFAYYETLLTDTSKYYSFFEGTHFFT